MEKTILIVDDNKGDRDLIKDALNNVGVDYKFIDAESGDQGIQLAQEFKPDLIVMDVVMPGMNGREAVQMLKKDEGTSTVPIVLLTGTYSKSEEEVYGKITIGDNVYDSISKPFDENKLIATIRKYV